MYLGRDWEPIESGETDVFSVDFSAVVNNGETITTSSVVCAVASNSPASDPTPSSRLIGVSSITNNIVSQRIGGCADGAYYTLTFQIVTSDGRTLKRWSRFQCTGGAK